MLPDPSLWPELDDAAVADVVVDAEAPDLRPTYTYAIPHHLRDLGVGECVLVPFGGQERIGYVMQVRRMHRSDPLAAILKPLMGRIHGAVTLDAQQVALVHWLAEAYVCDLLSAVRCVVPAGMAFSLEKVVTLASSQMEPEVADRSILQAHVLTTLKRMGGRASAEALRKACAVGSFPSAYSALVRKGLIREEYRLVQPRITQRTILGYSLGPVASPLTTRLSAEAKRVLDVLAVLAREGKAPIPAGDLAEKARVSPSLLRSMAARGAILAERVPVRRIPYAGVRSGETPVSLTPWQDRAIAELASLASGAESTHNNREALLFGVTASGKTEVYLHAIEHVLATGRNAVVLLPEIALTTQLVGIFARRFGDLVAVLHSGLSEGERYDEWRRLQQGAAKIAVGARSAVFAPLSNIGLFILDEEHEPSYKQETTPRYHARDVARQRARSLDALVVLGSATPSLETFYEADRGRIACIRMEERIDRRPLPEVQIVDMREEWKRSRCLLSEPLVQGLRRELGRGKQAILFLNRRGYSQFMLCRDCGHVIRCPNCAVSLTLHAAETALKCHHCNYQRTVPHLCPQCGGTRIRGFGLGTERVEEETARVIPEARIARMDRDTTARKGAHAAILNAFRRGEVNVLIGTQMVAKGLDFPDVTLVGVVSADTSINMPDFRAAERTFQLVTQVAGRSGRGDEPGRVLVQTFDPEHYSLQMAASHDYEGFYRREIAFRDELRYPPFARLANLVCFDESASHAQAKAVLLAEALKKEVGTAAEVIGPAPAPLSKLKGNYRIHVVVRTHPEAPLPQYILHALSRLPSTQRQRISVDMDPVSMA
ncbi:MAG: primosomal protein N' [Chthonomonadales bacterium]